MTLAEQILHLLRSGLDTIEIAERLTLSEAEVYNLLRAVRAAS